MVEGKHINDDEIEAFIASASIIIAHNSKFERRFVEPRFPIFKTKPWACSFAQIDWSTEGLGRSKLEFLAYRSGFHYEGHRASTDCHALLEVLHCAPTESGTQSGKFGIRLFKSLNLMQKQNGLSQKFTTTRNAKLSERRLMH